jgi:hypothetical protein
MIEVNENDDDLDNLQKEFIDKLQSDDCSQIDTFLANIKENNLKYCFFLFESGTKYQNIC